MKRVGKLAVAGMVLFSAGFVLAQESLGELAREQKQMDRPHARKVFTNDDLSSQSAPALTVPSSEAATAKDAAGKAASKTKDSSKDDAKLSFPMEEMKKRNQAYRAKLETQKDSIELLNREINVARRELNVQAATYYADAGTRLRDPQLWEKTRSTREAEIAAKQNELEEAKKKLDDIREEGRKAGVPAVYLDE